MLDFSDLVTDSFSLDGTTGLSFGQSHVVYVLTQVCSYVFVLVVSLISDLRGRRAFVVRNPCKLVIVEHCLLCLVSKGSAIITVLTAEYFFQIGNSR